MSYQVNGSNGKYGQADFSYNYGRNAVNNNIKTMLSPINNDNYATPPIFNFSTSPEAQEKNLQALENYLNENDKYLKSLPPLEYEYRYVPKFTNGQIDKKALFGAAYEEMGRKKELSIQEFENRYLSSDSQTAKPMDINKDGNIDVAEYGANIIATDILSKDSTDPLKADGSINSKGLSAIMEYSKKNNAISAEKLYSNIYNTYDLGNSLKEIK